MRIYIDLFGCKTEKEVLTRLGEILQLGGANGNHEIQSEIKGKGWGMNWDALKDSLTSLDEGGIWGDNIKPRFPLRIFFNNYDDYIHNDLEGFHILKDICQDVSQFYKKKKHLSCNFMFHK